MSTVAARPLPHRLLDTFVSPGELFEEIRDHETWAGPLAVSVVLSTAIYLAMPQDLLVEMVAEAARRQGGEGARMDPEAMAGFARVSMVGSQIVGLPLVAFATAGLLTLVFRLVLGGEGRYRQFLAVTTHAQLILTLGALVTLPIQLLRRDISTQLSLSLLAPFLESGSAPYLILQGLNVFTLWMLVVLALGVSIVDRRRSWAGASAILIGIYLTVVVATALWRAG